MLFLFISTTFIYTVASVANKFDDSITHFSFINFETGWLARYSWTILFVVMNLKYIVTTVSNESTVIIRRCTSMPHV